MAARMNTSIYNKPVKTTYHILGEDIEVDGSKSLEMVNIICTLNVLGRPFYEEIKKQGVVFTPEIVEHIEKRLKIVDRDLKINKILE